MKKALAAIALIGLAATAAALPSQAMDNAQAQVDTPEEEEAAENASQEEEPSEPAEERRGPPSFVQNLMPQQALDRVPGWLFG